MKRLGPQGLDKKATVQRFRDRGVHKVTLYRWVNGFVASGVPDQALARHVKAATATRIKRHKGPEAASKAVATDVVAALPAVVTVDDIAAQGGVVPAIDQLNFIITTARKIVDQAKGGDPTRCWCECASSMCSGRPKSGSDDHRSVQHRGWDKPR